jgi:NTE family protein
LSDTITIEELINEMNNKDNMTTKKKKYNIGLVLSGGGTRGFAHIGAIKALREAGIYPDVISGVSAGAIAGALIADGHSPDDIMKMFKETKTYKYIEFIIPKNGLLRMTGLAKILKQNLRAKTFEELSIPFFVNATDLTNGRPEYFYKGELMNRVLASSTVPVLFQPVKMENKTYVDGGVMNNFPTEPIEKKCNLLIGVYVNPLGYVEDFTSMMSIAERSFHLCFSTLLGNKSNKCDIYIEPPELKDYRLLDVAKIKDIYQLGYKETKKVLKENKDLIALYNAKQQPVIA